MEMINRKTKTDILVVGGGLSGIKVSKELADQSHRVLMVTKMKVASGSSFYPLKASLGTQVTKDENDEKLFLRDIEELSHGMHQKDLAEVYVQEISNRVQEYPEIGIHAKKLEGERKACFAQHSRDIYLLSDWDQIRNNVNDIFDQYENLEIMEHTVVVTLLKEDNQVIGAILLDNENQLVLVECKAVILATGGFGSIFKHNLNPNDVDGSGHILALNAGAHLVNMEYIQFIPGITTPNYKTLFGEQTLMYCHDIVNDNGESLIDSSLPKGLSKKECMEIRSTHGPFTHSLPSRYFDISMMNEIIATRNEKGFRLLYDPALYENKEEFYTVYLNWLQEKNVHFVKDEVRIAPFAHASNGGVYIDTYGRTGIEGLYAIGELSCNIEGANRLGGNSTGACMVFGKRAAEDCGMFVKQTNAHEISTEEASTHVRHLFGLEEEKRNMWEVEKKGNDEEHTNDQKEKVQMIIEQVKEIMWYSGNVVRSETHLLASLKKLKELEAELDCYQLFHYRSIRKLTIKAMNFLQLSQILLTAMLERRESRGAHYREDYPYESPDFNKRLFISKNNNGWVKYKFINQ